MTPRVSVIIPAKDVEQYIAEALTSLLHQGLDPREMEVVVIDDGSTDRTADIAAGFADRFGSFQLLRNPRPGGVSAARNQGMRASTGATITFLDSDDWYGNGHLQVMVDAVESLGVQFVRTDIIRATGKSRELTRCPVFVRGRRLDPHDFIAHDFERTIVDFPNPPTGLFDRALLEDGTLLFAEDLRSAEDREWNWRILLNTESFAVVDTPGAYYRRGVAGSLTAVYDETQLDFVTSCRRTIEQTRAQPEWAPYTLKAAHNLLALTDIHLQRSAEMGPGVRQELIREVARTTAALTDEERDAVTSSFTQKRLRTLAPVLRGVHRLTKERA